MNRPLQRLGRFFRELKRRRVYRVGATYAAVAFVVWQAASFLLPAFNFPPWTVDFVVILSVLGFPLALVLAWAFEVTPDGVRWTRSAVGAEEGEEPGPGPRRGTVLVLVAGVALLSAGGLWLQMRGSGGSGIDRLAVLPLANLMDDPEQEYFVQGMHHEIISELQQAGVPVIARTSVTRYADGETPARDIARELGVGAVVEGAVRRLGDSVEIDASIVDPETEQYVWSETFHGSLREIEYLYQNLTRAIADEIQAALDAEARARMEQEAGPLVPDAYDAYLKGIYHSQSFTPQDFDVALEYFRRALAIDSSYAPAYVGVARVWQFRAQAAQFTGVTPEEARRHIRPALERALALDSGLAEAHMAVGWLSTWNEWELEEGRAAFERAIELNPGHAEARVFYGHLLAILGRWEQARAHAEEAVELDPLNPFIASLRGVVLNLTRRYRETIDEMETFFRRHPDAPGFGRTALINSYHMLGREEEVLTALRERYESRDETLVAILEQGYREGGYREALHRLADTLVARNRSEGGARSGPYGLYAMAGDEEAAIRWLERALEAHSQNIPYIGVSPILERLHDRPRFRELARRAGIPLVTAPREGEGTPTTGTRRGP